MISIGFYDQHLVADRVQILALLETIHQEVLVISTEMEGPSSSPPIIYTHSRRGRKQERQTDRQRGAQSHSINRSLPIRQFQMKIKLENCRLRGKSIDPDDFLSARTLHVTPDI